MNTLSYYWAILIGFYFYAIFQGIYLLRFGSLNTAVSYLDLFVVAVGIASVLVYMYFARKLESGKALLLIPFAIALPFAYIGAMGGGLIGAFGIFIFGLVPFAVLLPLGYWLVKKFGQTNTVLPPTVTM